MHFTKLRLTGFKSFTDPTDLLIQPGLTGIVGPNGCGKSNLLEALRWVMGENRPTAMRGSGMEDVIFNGSASRPARNFAEVALTLDNSDRTAPAGFNDSDTLEVVRRITRDVGSAFKVNGKDVRARDVQMLFADASTGAHSPALVRQGQISELVNARPRARRRILEEAAGISGLYQRRHEAELKLNAAETNLTRVEDVLEQLRQQLSTLARQAKQAARYRRIGEELRRAEAMLAWRRWHEADLAHAEAASALQQATTAAARAESAATAAARARAEAEEKLPPLREEEAIAAAVLQRVMVERDSLEQEERRARQTIQTLESRIAQLGSDIERETALGRDAGETIQRLEWEHAQLEKAGIGFDDKLAAANEAARLAARTLKDEESRLAEMTEDVARLAARHQSARRLLEDGRRALARSEAAAEQAARALEQAEAALADAESRQTRARADHKAAEAEAQAAEAALAEVESARASVQADEADARAARAEAEGEAKALSAELSALGRMLDQSRAEGEQILNHVRVAPGFEAALGAALADDLKAPELEGTETDDGRSGWRALPDYATPQPLPQGVQPLAAHVTAPAALARRLSQVGVVDRAAGPRLQAALRPGQRLVSREGDLWRWDGFVATAGDAPSAAALRLQQMNRFDELTALHEQAAARAARAADHHQTLVAELERLSTLEAQTRTRRREADAALTAATRAASRAEADRDIAFSRLETARQALARHRDEAEANRRMMAEAEQAVAGLDDLDAARAAAEQAKVAVEAARMAMMTRRSMADELRREGEARLKRLQEITQEISGWRLRLDTADRRIAELRERLEASEAELAAAREAPARIAARRAELQQALERAEARKTAATDALAGAESALRQAVEAEREATRRASEAREERARAEARAEAAQTALSAALERMEEDTGHDPAGLLQMLGSDGSDMPAAERIEADIARLRRQRDALGAVNLRAEEDAAEVEAELTTLSAEKADLEAAIAKLRHGIASLNREGRERLLAAFDQVNRNFASLFTHLFGGGEARLVLVESDDPLEAGLEIMCQPPGKKLSTLSLLSGGEKTLTALALIFAVFLANPAPICVLDEVDAPLDDANVNRFCAMLDEMVRRTETRYLIITHHATTMSRMDRLFGVTMAEQGVSQLVSVDLGRAERLVA